MKTKIESWATLVTLVHFTSLLMEKSSDSLLVDILKVALIFLLAAAMLSVASFSALRVIVRGKEVEVPNVIGREYTDASKILGEHGLNTVKIEGEKYSATLPKGHVIKQDPIPMKKVKLGRTIKVFLSKGTELGQVPRLTGYPVTDVESRLTSAGLEMGAVVKVHSDDFPQEGIIIAHTPPADVIAEWGAKVNLLVSLGPHSVTLMMPDLRNMDLQKALETLKRSGLKQGRITKETSPAIRKADIVLEHSPQADERVERNTAVDIVVSSGKISKGTYRRAILSYVVPLRPRILEDPEEQEDLSPRQIEIMLEHEGGMQKEPPRASAPGTLLSIPLRIKGQAIVKIYVDGIFTKTMICNPPSRKFVAQ